MIVSENHQLNGSEKQNRVVLKRVREFWARFFVLEKTVTQPHTSYKYHYGMTQN
ncbi:hypothetical protein GCM10009576_099570 [Streptomyces rhizosphaericus]|uniref:Transposase n=1 Tax=Streptomyces rhizosphaericus TaxID=114699 RepID=A0ABN1TDY0_9ACTN